MMDLYKWTPTWCLSLARCNKFHQTALQKVRPACDSLLVQMMNCTCHRAAVTETRPTETHKSQIQLVPLPGLTYPNKMTFFFLLLVLCHVTAAGESITSCYYWASCKNLSQFMSFSKELCEVYFHFHFFKLNLQNNSG